jgi:hypothetical protein
VVARRCETAVQAGPVSQGLPGWWGATRLLVLTVEAS